MRIIAFTVLLVLFLQSCSEEQGCNTEDFTNIQWVQQVESSLPSGQEQFIVDEGQKFEPSRFRQIFFFRSDHSCSYKVLAPNDAHYEAAGTWSYETTSQELTIFDDAHLPLFRYQLLECSESRLKFLRLTP